MSCGKAIFCGAQVASRIRVPAFSGPEAASVLLSLLVSSAELLPSFESSSDESSELLYAAIISLISAKIFSSRRLRNSTSNDGTKGALYSYPGSPMKY